VNENSHITYFYDVLNSLELCFQWLVCVFFFFFFDPPQISVCFVRSVFSNVWSEYETLSNGLLNACDSDSDNSVMIFSTFATIQGLQQHASDGRLRKQNNGKRRNAPTITSWTTKGRSHTSRDSTRACNNRWVIDISHSHSLLGRDTQKHIKKLCLSHIGKNRRWSSELKVYTMKLYMTQQLFSNKCMY
jgi:hypothetical protein